ncbi:extracellular solute-binding protein [Anaerolineales bacterium HSG24]|nr:extracellular solute-binding protein [Anaerolineales bacterium HSG24]
MFHKKSLLTTILLLVVFAVTACGGDTTPAEPEKPAVEEAKPEEKEEAKPEEKEEAKPEEKEEAAESTEAVEIRFTYYADGNEADVMQGILDNFGAENPDINVVLDVVPYQTIDTQLPVQVETGEGPDMARITNYGAYRGKLLDMRTYMADASYYESNFPDPVLAAMRAEGDTSGLHGFPDGLTVTGPYVNKTLFEQADIAMPGEGATWAEWTEATQAVAETTGVQYAISIDRTGHRFAGPAMSMGATLIDADGNFTVDTSGFRAFAETLNGWHEAGITPAEVWLVGDSINSCVDAFKSGELVMCMSGSWQINGLAADVGDAFDWVVVPNPTGDGGSTGVAGGSGVVAFADTEHPEAVSKLMEFLIQEENYGTYSAGTLSLPAQIAVASSGVDFQTDNEVVLNALSAFTAEIPKLQDQAVGLNVHPFAFAYYRNSANRIGQYLTGELTLDEAVQRLQKDIDDAIAEAMAGVEEAKPEEKEAAESTEPAEIRFTYYADGNEADVMQGVLDSFGAENPNITVVLDVVPYQTIDTQLPVQVETGEGPDMARITNYGAYRGKLLDMRTYMADASYYESNFPDPVLAAMRAEGDTSGLHGFPDGLTVTGPYVNKTLFEQADIAMPGEGATWAEWTEATQAVAETTGVQYAISIDRTGHRFAGPAMSMGATLIDADGNFTVDTSGFRAFAETLNGWHEAGITPAEVWLVGDSINSCVDAFKSGELVMCMSGSWQINGLAADVGDAFDWVVVSNPTGDGGSTGVAGGSGVVAFADTEHPEAVSKLMEFLIQEENYGTYSAGTLSLPAQIAVASSGVDFQTDNEVVLNALSAFTAEIPKLQDQAVGLNVHPFAFAYYRNSANRIGQYLTGELTLDEAVQRLQKDIDDAIAEAMAGE